MTARVGIDIGSTATKVAVLDEAGDLACILMCPTGYSGTEAALRAQDMLRDQGFDLDDMVVVATGYGRVSVPFAQKAVTEITCHGLGASRLFGPNGMVVDVGGQDTKVIQLRNGMVSKFQMNDKCSAGTGRFLEIMSTRLGVTQGELSELARHGEPTTISSMCTVFAESEIISLVGKGEPRENIAYAIVESVAGRVAALASQLADTPAFLTGGLCENDYFVERLGARLGIPLDTCPEARYAGAIGAAIMASRLA